MSRTLKEIEKSIRVKAKQVEKTGIEIGRELMTIEANRLYEKEGFESMSAYLKGCGSERLGLKRHQCENLLKAATVEGVVRSVAGVGDTCHQLTHSHLRELAKLAPDKKRKPGEIGGVKKDYAKLSKAAVKKVLATVGDEPSVRDIRQAVKDQLGIKPKPHPTEKGIDLGDYLSRFAGTLEGTMDNLRKVPDDSWQDYLVGNPKLATKLTKLLREFIQWLE